MPRVSVIMSVYNTPEGYLREAIESVINQSFVDFEFVIVDDNSNEETKMILRDYTTDSRIIILENERNQGLTRNLNKALSISKGELVARMDADDICDLSRFQKQVDFLDNNPAIAMVGTFYTLFDTHRRIKHKNEGVAPAEVKTSLFFSNSSIMHSSVMMRHSVFNTEDGFCYDENYTKSQDFELWTRASHFVELSIIPEYLMYYRLSDKQVSRVSSSEQISLKKKVLLRQLSFLKDDNDEDSRNLHCSFCIGDKVSSVRSVVKWADILIQSNNNKGLYPSCIFNYFVTRRAIKSSVKSIHSLIDLIHVFCYFFLYLRNRIRYALR